MTSALDSARRHACARFLLDTALKLGIHVGARDADDIIMLAPMRVPREVRRWFEIQLDKYGVEVAGIIQRENAGRRS
jgi:hypothetical protein